MPGLLSWPTLLFRRLEAKSRDELLQFYCTVVSSGRADNHARPNPLRLLKKDGGSGEKSNGCTVFCIFRRVQRKNCKLLGNTENPYKSLGTPSTSNLWCFDSSLHIHPYFMEGHRRMLGTQEDRCPRSGRDSGFDGFEDDFERAVTTDSDCSEIPGIDGVRGGRGTRF